MTSHQSRWATARARMPTAILAIVTLASAGLPANAQTGPPLQSVWPTLAAAPDAPAFTHDGMVVRLVAVSVCDSFKNPEFHDL